MPVTKFPGGVAAGGGSSDATVAGAIYAMRVSFDPTSATQVLLGTLPAGAVPIDILGFGGATGGTNPTVELGTLADDDGYAVELDADAGGTSATAGADLGVLMNIQVTTPTAVYGKVGTSAATGGTFKGAVLYVIEDLP